MVEWTSGDWERDWASAAAPSAVFVHTPLCGTCSAARMMLDVAERLLPDFPLAAANLNRMPQLAQAFHIQSVPCLLIKRSDGTWDKQYRFPSVMELVERLGSEMRGTP